MIRRNFWLGGVGLSMGLVAGLAVSAPAPLKGAPRVGQQAGPAQASQIVERSEYTAIHYNADLLPYQVMARAKEDAERLGFPFVKTLAKGGIAIVKGSREDVAAAIATAENLPITCTSPVYGDLHRAAIRDLFAYSSRVGVRFAPTATEAQKVRFYAANGLTGSREYPSGLVVAESGRQPDRSMVAFAASLVGNGVVQSAIHEEVITGELCAQPNSLSVPDPLLDYQWYLINTAANTGGAGFPIDQDIDAPAAWQIREQAGEGTPFGDPSVTTAVFDTGTELSHEDLAENIDPAIGRDAIDSGLPIPTLSSFGTHGTFIAGLIAAKSNDTGVAGVAPNTKIYTSRIFSDDFSTTNLNLSAAIEDTIFKDIDVNVHPYVVGLDATAQESVETSLQLTWESGRSGVGLPNIAASGNFYSQVEFPASSRWTFAVGSSDSKGGRPLASNWGGEGIDFVMPSYVISADSPPPYPNLRLYSFPSTGIVGLDRTGQGGSSTGNYQSLGSTQIGESTEALSRNFQGTSVSAGLAAGVVAMLYSDPRYGATDLRPLNPVVRWVDRQAVAQSDRRAPFRPLDIYVLSKLKEFSDLVPGPLQYFQEDNTVDGDLSFADLYPKGKIYSAQFNPFLGFGQPNVARAIGDPTSRTEDSFPISRLTPFYSASFLGTGPTGIFPTLPDGKTPNPVFEELAGGWSPTTQLLAPALGDDQPPISVSPYLDQFTRIYFETDVPGEEPEPPPPDTFIYAWTDSLTTGSDLESAPTVENLGDEDLVFNPIGQYHNNFLVGLQSPPLPYTGGPMVLEMDLAFELGVEDASNIGTVDLLQTFTAVVGKEMDRLYVDVIISPPDPGAPSTRIRAGELTGDTTSAAKVRLAPATFVDLDPDPIGKFWRPSWTGGVDYYNPWVDDSQMIVRTFRFTIPNVPPGIVTFELSLQPGDSELPTWFLDTDENGVTTAEQMYQVKRDHKGFIFTGVRAYTVDDQDYLDHLNTNTFHLAPGNIATWSHTRAEITSVTPDPEGADASLLSRVDPFPPYLTSPEANEALPDGLSRREPVPLVTLAGEVTGMKAHTYFDFLTVTKKLEGEDGIYFLSSDGINETLLYNDEGARDPFWASTGLQLLYATDSGINLVSFDDPPNATVTFQGLGDSGLRETVVSSDTYPFLTDFHSPVLSADTGAVIFAARNGEGGSLNLYMATRNGRLIPRPPETDITIPYFGGWDGVDIMDLEPSPSGSRLAFVASATSAPEGGAPAVPSSTTAIFFLENLANVLTFGDEPRYSKPTLALPPDFNPGFQVIAARRPEIVNNGDSAGNEMVWASYTLAFGESTEGKVATIVRQPISVEPLIPPDDTIPTGSPTPTPIPTSTPTAPNNGQIVEVSSFTFDGSDEGWQFGNAAPALQAPVVDYSRTGGVGDFTLSSDDNNNTFGFVDSPKGILQARPDSLYLVRANISATADTPAADAPTVRLRVNSRNFENAYTAETNSLGDLSLSADPTVGRNFDLLFKPSEAIPNLANVGNRSFNVSVDLMNFIQEDSPNGGIQLNSVSLYKFDDYGKNHALWSFSTTARGNVTLVAIGTDGLDGDLTLTVRKCCYDADTQVSCTTGSTASGVTLNLPNLEAGNYTFIATTNVERVVTLQWNSTTAFVASTGDTCLATSVPETKFCASRQPISGAQGEDFKTTMYDGKGELPLSTCEPDELATVVSKTQPVYTTEFASAFERSIWKTGPSGTDFSSPVFNSVEGALELSVSDQSNTFGFWSTEGNSIPTGSSAFFSPESILIYRLTAQLVNNEETDPKRVPDLRVRMATRDFQRSVSGLFVSNGLGSTQPTPGDPRELVLYMTLEETPADLDALIAAFDVLSFYDTSRSVSSKPIRLEKIKIERVYIPNYPAPR